MYLEYGIMSDYTFHTLSPIDFENLVRDLLQSELSVRLESFKAGRDFGIAFTEIGLGTGPDFHFSQENRGTSCGYSINKCMEWLPIRILCRLQ